MITSTATFGRDLEDIDQVLADPMELLGLWLPHPDSELRPLMTLSTIDPEGYPNSRNVLLSAFDGSGLYFHTDARSRKAADLELNPRVSLVLVWPEVGRQISVQGTVEQTSSAEAAAVFTARSRYLQLLAWANDVTIAQLSHEERRNRWAAFGDTHPVETLEAPPTWVGYRVVPRRVTFWRGDPEGPSNRIEYRRDGAAWTSAKLPG
ncbi:pyridoxine/pyridoxamine 5'-phosphate oxidase [Psychromicrobium xiongbiense]|uniref:pyridoxine/pyridoxamine 5'-phosphate oxidase n=1 Tax=Psychromicrobium xiongbiense TaxID=3051184 RepID=UPI002556F312|nr:pyridoxal 5'-phosphate synthase [Psychromicrobium sp. YIM S02556]